MEYNFLQHIIVAVPSNMSQMDIDRFCQGVHTSFGGTCKIKVARNDGEFCGIMFGLDSDKYSICILLETFKSVGYSGFLRNVRAKNPYVKVLIVSPKECKGGNGLAGLIRDGEYNILLANDLTPDNLRSRIAQPLTRAEALTYCMLEERQVSGYASVGENEVMVTGNAVDKYEGEEKSNSRNGIISERVYKGVKVTTILGKAAGAVLQKNKNIEKRLGFMDDPNGGMDTVKVKSFKEFKFDIDPEWMEVHKEGLRNFYRREGLAIFKAFEQGGISTVDFRAKTYTLLPKTGITEEEKDMVIDSFLRDTVSYGKLDVAINHPDVSDIVLLGKDVVTVQVKGVWYLSNIKFKNDDEYAYFIGRICTKNKVQMNTSNAQIIFTDVSTNDRARMRFATTSAFLNTNDRHSMTIRLIDKKKVGMSWLVNQGVLRKREADFLINELREGSSIVICGGTGSGKTILLNNLIEYFDDDKRGVFVQEAEELFADTKVNIEFTHTVVANGDGKVEYDLKDIAKGSLMKGTRVFGIGEIKGDEARDFFSAANTGNQCLCTTHCSSEFGALERIADLAKYVGDYTKEDIMQMLSVEGQGIDIVVYMEKFKVRGIVSVVGWDDEAKDVIYDSYDFTNAE